MGKKYVGIIGGSGLYNIEGMKTKEEVSLSTPYGNPSDKVLLGELRGVPVAFISRHGRGHIYNPSEVNYRANIYAMKVLGVEQILSVTAVGSMKKDLSPGHIVIVDQYIDRTRNRPYTFFEKGIVAHVSFARPVCHKLVDILYDAAKKVGATAQKGGTYVCIEGPMFSSKAESNLYRSWGVDVIGMTTYQEARLAREAEICYATISMVTDYDCWHESEDAVDASAVLRVMKKNVEIARQLIKEAVQAVFAEKGECCCNSAAKNAILTDPKMISADAKQRLEPIIGKYIK